METIFDEYLRFPEDEWTALQFDKLHKLVNGVEQIEEDFQIEFSCGDGKFPNDASHEEHDGKVCLKSVPRFSDTKELFKVNKEYRFTIKNIGGDFDETVVFLINGKERSRRDV